VPGYRVYGTRSWHFIYYSEIAQSLFGSVTGLNFRDFPYPLKKYHDTALN